jgi:ketosteroid isomerase-like protein
MKPVAPVAVVALLLSSMLAGCAARKIPGTDIDDSSTTREVLLVMEKYRSAVEAKDVPAIVTLADKTFRDTSGSAAPEDDLDYATLGEKLPERFGKLGNIKLNISVRRIQVEGDVANAIYYYTATYQLTGPDKKSQTDSDLKQMWFKRVGGQWKITSGI